MAMVDLKSPSGQTFTAPPSAPANPMSPRPKNRPVGKVLGLLLVLLLLLAGLWYLSGGSMQVGEPYVDVAPKGEPVKSFPTALLPSGNPYVESSYSINYRDDDRRFPVVTFTSTIEYEQAIDEFRRLLQADGWLILKDGSVEETPLTNFYATKGEAQVNITVEDKEIGPWVIIAYSEPS